MKTDIQKSRIQLIVAIGLAVLAAVFMIVGGIIGYKKWNDLKENEEQKKQEEVQQETEEEQEEVRETDEVEQEQQEVKEMTFEQYVKDILEPELGTFEIGEYRYQYVLEKSNGNEWSGGSLENGSGIITTQEWDLDQDGEKEYMVFYLNGDCQDTDGNHENRVQLMVYEKKGDTFEKTAETELLNEVLECSSDGDWRIYLKQVNGSTYICTQKNLWCSDWYDLGSEALKVVTYADNELKNLVSENTYGTYFEESEELFRVGEMLDRIGLIQSAQQIYKFWNYEFAAEEMGEPLIEFTAEIENPDSYTSDEMRDYIENRESEKLPYVIGKGQILPIQEQEPESGEQETADKEKEILSETAQQELYASVIEEYIEGITAGNWNRYMYINAELCGLCAEYDNLNEIGYTFLDVDGNGILELMIGAIDNQSSASFFAMYTIVDNEVVMLADSEEYYKYYISTNYEIVCEGAAGTALSSYRYYGMSQDGTSLVLKEKVVYDLDTDEAAPWFYHTSENWDSRTPIMEEEANEIIHSREYMSIAYTTLAEYKSQKPQLKTAEEVYQLLLEHYAADIEDGATFFEGEVVDGHYEMSARCAVPGNPDGASQALYFIDVDMSTGEVVERNQILMKTTVYQLFEAE